jgi:hypothetical protein
MSGSVRSDGVHRQPPAHRRRPRNDEPAPRRDLVAVQRRNVARGEVLVVVRRPADVVDEDLLERHLVDLEVRHGRAVRDRDREHRVGLDALVELDLGPADAGSQDPHALDAREPRQPVVALDRDVEQPPPRRAADLAQ